MIFSMYELVMWSIAMIGIGLVFAKWDDISGYKERKRKMTRNELSMKNENYIPKFRFLELKYYCLQYPEWLEEYNDIQGYLMSSSLFENDRVDGGEKQDEEYRKMARSCNLRYKMDKVKHTLLYLPAKLQSPIFEAVTTGKGWTVIQAKYELVCTRDEYFNAYHTFFKQLDILMGGNR